ncbi:hypothetical protein ACFQ9X_18480 [Catenulispora yoronensis]
MVVTGPSADSMTNQLGGWSVSWQGVAGAGHVCCMGLPDQIPPGTTVQKGVLGADVQAKAISDQAAAVPRRRTPMPTWPSSGRRPTPRAWATTRLPRCRRTSRR